jgi:hypothetical protein
MPQISIKDAIAGLRHLPENVNVPIIDLMRPWMTLTGLEFKDAVHMTADDLVKKLLAVHAKLGDSLDLLDEDQLQEAACRCLKKITVYGDLVGEGDIVLSHGQDVSWDGSTWNFVVDPKLRMRQTSKHYLEAITAVKELLAT